MYSCCLHFSWRSCFLLHLLVIGCFTVSQCRKCYWTFLQHILSLRFLVQSSMVPCAPYGSSSYTALQIYPRLCASGLEKQYGLSKHRCCVGWTVCSSLLITLIMFRQPKLHINCFIYSVLQFKDELLLILSSYLWFDILPLKPILINFYCFTL